MRARGFARQPTSRDAVPTSEEAGPMTAPDPVVIVGAARTPMGGFLGGLEDAYDKGRLMGTFAEDCAEAYQFTREAQDAYALTSLERANRAIRGGDFVWEIAPVSVKAAKSETLVATDEQPPKARPEKIPTLKPAFRDGGTVTAANSS